MHLTCDFDTLLPLLPVDSVFSLLKLHLCGIWCYKWLKSKAVVNRQAIARMANLEIPIWLKYFLQMSDVIHVFICCSCSFYLLVQSCFLPQCSSILLQCKLHFHHFHSRFPVEWHQILPICTVSFLTWKHFIYSLVLWSCKCDSQTRLSCYCHSCRLNSTLRHSTDFCDQICDYTKMFIWSEVENIGIHFYIVSCVM